MSIRSLAVFCGSKTGNNPVYVSHAQSLGKLLAEKNVSLVYGGGNSGIMGYIADAVLEHHGKVVGIIPQLLVEWEKKHAGITEMIVTEDMHIRKKMLYSRCDSAIILPGGFGTLDELFEIVTWNQLSIHDKPIFILNSGGFYDHLMAHIKVMKDEGFLYADMDQRITLLDDPSQLTPYLI